MKINNALTVLMQLSQNVDEEDVFTKENTTYEIPCQLNQAREEVLLSAYLLHA